MNFDNQPYLSPSTTVDFHGHLSWQMDVNSVPTIDSVTAASNNQAGTGSFGAFLTGVPLADPFTVTVGDASNVVKEVDYYFDAKNTGRATRVGTTNQWKFTQDVGNLPADDNKLTVTLYDAGHHALATKSGDVAMKNSLQFGLKETYPGGPAGGVDVAGLRYIRGVPMPGTFTGSFTDLPSYYDGSFTHIDVGAKQVPITVVSTNGT